MYPSVKDSHDKNGTTKKKIRQLETTKVRQCLTKSKIEPKQECKGEEGKEKTEELERGRSATVEHVTGLRLAWRSVPSMGNNKTGEKIKNGPADNVLEL